MNEVREDDSDPSDFVSSEIQRILSSETAHEVLGVMSDLDRGEGISRSKVKENYNRLVRTVHPDKCTHPNANSAFLRLKSAYDEINADFDNPRPHFHHNQNRSTEAKPAQRLRFAAFTSKVLRGVAYDSAVAERTSGCSDFNNLRRFFGQSGDNPATRTKVTREEPDQKIEKESSSKGIMDLIDVLSPANPEIVSSEDKQVVEDFKKCSITSDETLS